MTATRKLTLGDSTIGYDTASVTTTSAGKLRLVPGSVVGRVSHIKRAIAAYNRTGQPCYTTTAGDEKSLHLSGATVKTETWEAWLDGQRDTAVTFEVPVGGTYDVAEAGADALGVDLSESVNVARA